MGGNAGLRDPKYWPATHGSDLYAYLARFQSQGPHACLNGRVKWGMCMKGWGHASTMHDEWCFIYAQYKAIPAIRSTPSTPTVP